MKLIVDLMGADNSPKELLKGCINSLIKYPELFITIVVNQGLIEEEIKNHDRINLIYSEDVIEVNDNLLTVTRRRNASMIIAMNEVIKEEYDGIISAGSTAAFVTSSIFIIKRMSGIQRPALIIDLPSINNSTTTMLDLGANIELSSEQFVELSLLTSKYVKYTREINNPGVSLLNIGEESKKGTPHLKEVYKTLEENKNINFKGNIESRYLLNNESDIIISDGYSGNLSLKAIEGMGVSIFSMIKEAKNDSLRNKLGLVLLKPLFKKMYKELDYNNYGGALLLGVNKIAIKAHGSSDYKTFESAIEQFIKIYDSNFIDYVKEG